MYLTFLIAGFGGGVLRGLVGFLKHQFSYKNVEFKLDYFLTTMFLSGVVGMLSSMAIKEAGFSLAGQNYINSALAFIIGYAGGDFLENIYKIIAQKLDIYSGK